WVQMLTLVGLTIAEDLVPYIWNVFADPTTGTDTPPAVGPSLGPAVRRERAAPLTLFGLLGATTAAEAAEKWPKPPFLPGVGVSGGGDDPSDYAPLLASLKQVLRF